MDKPTESDLESNVVKKKVNNNRNNSSPIKLTASSSSSYTTLATTKHDMDRDSGSLSSNLKEPVNPARSTTKEYEGALIHPTNTTTSTSTTMDKRENSSRITSPLSSIYMSHENKETDSGPSVVEAGMTKEEKPHDNIITRTDIQSSSPSSLTSIVSGKDKDKDIDTHTYIQPVIAEVTQPIVEVRPEEQQSEKNEQTSLDLTTIAKLESTSIEEAKPISTSLMPANLEQTNQISLYDEGHTTTDENENANSTLGGYINPFFACMAMWQAWLDMCSESAAIGASLSLDWLESFWKFLIPPSKEATGG